MPYSPCFQNVITIVTDAGVSEDPNVVTVAAEEGTGEYILYYIWHTLLHGQFGKAINSSCPGQNGRHFADILRCIFVNKNFCIL